MKKYLIAEIDDLQKYGIVFEIIKKMKHIILEEKDMIRMIQTKTESGLIVGDTVRVMHDWDPPHTGEIVSISSCGMFARVKKQQHGKPWINEYQAKDLVKVDPPKNDLRTILANFCNEVKGTKINPETIEHAEIYDNKVVLKFKNRKVIISETLTANHFLRYFGDRHLGLL